MLYSHLSSAQRVNGFVSLCAFLRNIFVENNQQNGSKWSTTYLETAVATAASSVCDWLLQLWVWDFIVTLYDSAILCNEAL